MHGESCSKGDAVGERRGDGEDGRVAPLEPQNPRAQLLSSLKSSVFILGTAIVMLVAFRNTLTCINVGKPLSRPDHPWTMFGCYIVLCPWPACLDWRVQRKMQLGVMSESFVVLPRHLQRFWGASGNFWQGQWDKVEAFFAGDEFAMGVWGTFAVTFLVYWVVGGLYTIMDLTGKPSFLLRYKIQDSAPYPVAGRRVGQVVLQVLFNQVVVGLPFGLLAHQLLLLRGYNRSGELPTFHWVVFELTVCILVEEAGFYYSHRLLHHPRLYKHVHKQHHEWTAPIAITAVYCHPLEHLFSNLMPPLLGVLLLGSHTATAWLWFTLAILSTLNAHSGFHFPLLPSPEAHDYHHLKFTQNYGVLGVLDRLHGTDNQFRQTKAYRRHLLLLSLVPLRELYPENSKRKDS